MEKRIFIPVVILVFGLVFNSCEQKPKAGYVMIKGTVDHPVNDGYIMLEKVDNDQSEVVDSVQLSSGNQFTLEVEAKTPQFFRINFFNRQRHLMILKSGIVTVEADGSSRNGRFIISGSPETNDLLSTDKLYNVFQNEKNTLTDEYILARNKSDSVQMHLVQHQYDSLEYAFHQTIKSSVDTMDGRLSALKIALDYIPMEGNIDFYGTLLSRLQATIPQSEHVEQLQEVYDKARLVSIGSPAPNLTLPNPDSTMISISSFKGQVLLLDFWASWCKPCRAENPNLVKTYKEYHSKGFEVLSISLDKKKSAWLKAIADDRLSWPQVSDLQYLDSKAIEIYNVQAIPTNYLIDKDGKIIAKNMFGKALDLKLKEILG